jgi:predicted MPP superfamily phosphohydrolase
MFHTIVTTAYIVPNIYVFLRLYNVFINKGYKLHFTIIYLLLAAFCPLARQLPDRWYQTEILSAISDYLLPFYLYLFLSVLVFDIFLLVNILFRLISSEKLSSSRFKITGLSVIIIVSATVVLTGTLNHRTIRTSEYKVKIAGRSSEIRRLKIAFVADFHLKEGKSIRFVKKFADRIDEIDPDLLLLGGDIVDDRRAGRDMATFEKLFRDIVTKYGTYAVPGNHEFYSGQDKGSFFKNAGIELLCDTIVVVGSSINLGGRYDSHFRGRKSIEDLLQAAVDSLPVIIMDHRPTEINRASLTSTDIHLSGHTHNGQLFPINLILRWIYELPWGYMKKNNTHFFVTSGLQLWGPPVRTAGKAEIMIIEISFEEQ